MPNPPPGPLAPSFDLGTSEPKFIEELQEKRDVVRAFNPEERQERARFIAVMILLGIFLAEVILCFVSLLYFKVNAEDLKDVAGIIITPSVTLLGTALGFYFSRK